MNWPDEWRDIERLAIFPLPVVLLPGMLMPLHIFEPRYRQMLHDCLQGARVLGLTYHPQSAVGTVVIPVEGSIGCMAQIASVVPLPDGRSNIMTVGACRYHTLEYIAQDPYLVARIELFGDEPAKIEGYRDVIEEVSELFNRFMNALRTLRDEPKGSYRLPDDPELASFMIASVVLSEPEDQLELLRTRSTLDRFQSLRQFLDEVIDEIESRASDHVAMRGNGRGELDIFH